MHGTLAGVHPLKRTVSDIDFGDVLQIGADQAMGGIVEVYDGCLAHAMVFMRKLDDREMRLYSSLVADDRF
ncbi:unnamed protein product [Sphagnum balticum]